MIMDKEQLEYIKKRIYKEKPKAELTRIVNGDVIYQCYLEEEGGLEGMDTMIIFIIPKEEQKEAVFLPEMEAKELVRWINQIL